MISYFRMPGYICRVLNYSAISVLIVFLFLSVVFAENNTSVETESAEKIHITADGLISDMNAKFAEFSGNVEAIQGEFVINSDRLKIFYKGDMKEKTASGTGESIEKIIAIGNVRIKSKDMSAVTQEAEYSTDTMILTLTGEDSKVFDQKNFIIGSKIVLYRKENKTKVEGDKKKRVVAVFYPKEKSPEAKEGEKGKITALSVPGDIEIARKEVKPEQQALLPENTGAVEKEKPIAEEAVIIPKEGEKEKITEPSIPQHLEIARIKVKPEQQALLPEKTGSVEKEKPAAKEAVIEPPAKPEIHAPVPAAVAPALVAKVPVAESKARPETAAEKIKPGTLKKIMGVTVFEDKTKNGITGFKESLSKSLMESIRKNYPDILFLKNGDNNYPSGFINLPKLDSGSIDTYKLCETARQMGLAAILKGTIMELKTDNESRGILFRKKTVPSISMSVRIEVFDTETGAKLFDEIYAYKEDSDKAGVELVKSGKAEPVFLKAALKYYTSSAGIIIGNIMKEQKWKGFISSVTENQAVITSGKNMGLAPGMVFNVFGNNVINGVENQKFIIPGMKAGEIKITKVLDNTSEAVMVSGSALKKDYTVKPK